MINQSLGLGWQLGLTHRYATGRPFTPVTGATFDAAQNVWMPRYGPPMSERLPSFRRLDLGLTRLQRIAGSQGVIFTAVNNLLDRDNLYAYRYPSDYSSRIPIRSIFKRSFYVGASITTQ